MARKLCRRCRQGSSGRKCSGFPSAIAREFSSSQDDCCAPRREPSTADAASMMRPTHRYSGRLTAGHPAVDVSMADVRADRPENDREAELGWLSDGLGSPLSYRGRIRCKAAGSDEPAALRLVKRPSRSRSGTGRPTSKEPCGVSTWPGKLQLFLPGALRSPSPR